MPYTKGKKGEDRFYADNGKAIYPPNNGAVGKEQKVILKVNTIIDRFGGNYGYYTSPEGTALEARAKNDLHKFKVVKELSYYESRVAPWFNQKGNGTQYRLFKSIDELLKEGFLVEISS